MSNVIRRIGLISSIAVLLTALTVHAGPPEPYQLDNGLTVILRPVSGANQVAVVLLFNLGGDHDPAGKSGRAHLLEHLYCTAGAGDTPARDFAQIQTRYVAGYNQQTGHDFTVLAGVVNAEELEEELKDAAARMGALHITDADLKREVPRVLVELSNMYDGIPSLAGLNHVRMGLHPIQQGGRHGGNAESIQTLALNELQELWQDQYKPNNAILVLAGKFDVTKVRKLVQQRFGPIPSGKAPPTMPLQPEGKTGITFRIKVKPVVQKAISVVSVGYAAPLPGSRDYAPFLLVVSRLWALSQNTPPDQVPPVFYPPLDDPTTIALQAALPDRKDAESVLNQLDQRLQEALTPKLNPQDKLLAINSMAMFLGTVDMPDAMWAQNLYGLSFSVGRRYQLKICGNELCATIQRTTDGDMQRLAATVFAPEKRITAIVEVEK
jgi:zinc protease